MCKKYLCLIVFLLGTLGSNLQAWDPAIFEPKTDILDIYHPKDEPEDSAEEISE